MNLDMLEKMNRVSELVNFEVTHEVYLPYRRNTFTQSNKTGCFWFWKELSSALELGYECAFGAENVLIGEFEVPEQEIFEEGSGYYPWDSLFLEDEKLLNRVAHAAFTTQYLCKEWFVKLHRTIVVETEGYPFTERETVLRLA